MIKKIRIILGFACLIWGIVGIATKMNIILPILMFICALVNFVMRNE